MRDLIILLVHLITTVFRLAGTGGLRSVVAESVLMKHQFLIVNRSRGRAPNICVWDRGEVISLQNLLQRISGALGATGTNSDRSAGFQGRPFGVLSLAETLSRFIPNTYGCMSTNSPCAGGKDRKSTRLNSSHLGISYAVFCLKKKNQK